MKKQKFKIEKVVEDKIIVELSREIKQKAGTISKLATRYGMGYLRKGASTFHFLKEEDVRFITEYYEMKKKWRKELSELEKKYNLEQTSKEYI